MRCGRSLPAQFLDNALSSGAGAVRACARGRGAHPCMYRGSSGIHEVRLLSLQLRVCPVSQLVQSRATLENKGNNSFMFNFGVLVSPRESALLVSPRESVYAGRGGLFRRPTTCNADQQGVGRMLLYVYIYIYI